MTTAPKSAKRAYHSPRRTEKQSQVHGRILAATRQLLDRDGMLRLTYPAIAAASGVSLRTVFRHFPDRATLVNACWRLSEHTPEQNNTTEPDDRSRTALQRLLGSSEVYARLVSHEGLTGEQSTQILAWAIQTLFPSLPPRIHSSPAPDVQEDEPDEFID